MVAGMEFAKMDAGVWQVKAGRLHLRGKADPPVHFLAAASGFASFLLLITDSRKCNLSRWFVYPMRPALQLSAKTLHQLN
jgi:hypothetical protein